MSDYHRKLRWYQNSTLVGQRQDWINWYKNIKTLSNIDLILTFVLIDLANFLRGIDVELQLRRSEMQVRKRIIYSSFHYMILTTISFL